MKHLIPAVFAALFLVSCGGGDAKQPDAAATPQISEQEKQEMQAIEAKTADLETAKEDIKKSTAEVDELLKGL